MTSKRNSRVFVDETKHCEVGHKTSSSRRSRRDSHGSADDDMQPPAKEAEDGQRFGTVPRETDKVPRTRSTSGGRRESMATSSSRIGEKTGKHPDSRPGPRLSGRRLLVSSNSSHVRQCVCNATLV